MQKPSPRVTVTPGGAAGRRRQLASSTGLALVLCLAAGAGLAETLRWDTGGAPGIQAGDGDWNFADGNWADTGGAPATFQTGDDVIFGGPTVGSPVVSITTDVAADSLRFEADGYTVAGSGGALVVRPGGGTTITVTGSNTAEIAAGLSDGGGTRTLTVDGGDDATLVLSGANGGAATDGLTVDVTGATVEIANDLGGSVVVRADGTVANQGTSTIGGTATVRAGGTLVGAGGDVAGGVTVEGGVYRVTGESTGSVTQTGGTVAVTATGTLDGSLSTSGGGATNNGTITGSVVQSGGSIANNGDVGGGLDLTGGTFTNATGGTVSGPATVNGADAVLVADGGDLAGGLVLQQGQVNVTGGSAAEVAQSGGTLRVQSGGTLQGNVALSGGTLAVQGGGPRGDLDGDVTQTGGAVTNAGIVRGAVTASAGTFTGSGAGDVRGLTTVSGTALVQTGAADFTGGVQVEGGELRVTGNSSGSVRQDGGLVRVTAGGRLDGTLTQGAGATARNAGTVAGDVIRSGGTLVNEGTGTLGAAGDEVRQSAGTLTNRGTIVADTVLSGGTFAQADGTVAGDVRVTGGTLNASGGSMTGEVRNAGGTINVTGAVRGGIVSAAGTTTVTATGALAGAQTVSGGTLRNDGRMSGSARVNAGTIVQAGTMTGTVRVEGGTLRQLAGSDTQGLTTVNGGILLAQGGRLSGGAVVNDDGRAVVSGSVAGDITVAAGASDGFPGPDRNLNVTATGRLAGDVTVAGGSAANDGRIAGALRVTGGAFEARQGSVVTGASQVTGGTVTLRGGAFTGGITASGGGRILVRTAGISTGPGAAGPGVDVTVGPSGSLDIGAGDRFEGTVTATGGTVGNLGILDGTLTASGGTTTQRGTITGATGITGTAVLNTFAGSRIDGRTTVAGGGTVNAAGGNFAGGLAVGGGGTLRVTGTIAGPLTSAGDGRILNGGIINGSIGNDGIATGAGEFRGLLTNTGRVDNGQGGGDLQLLGGLRGGATPASGVVDLTRNTDTGNAAAIGGAGVSGGQTFRFNVDLADRSADVLTLQSGASLSGNLRFELYARGVEGNGQLSTLESDDLTRSVVLAEAEGGGTLTLPVETNLRPSTSRIVLGLDLDDQGRIVLESDFNPAFGAIVGNIVLTQSLIGSVINRPTSAAFTPLQDAEDPCGPGIWGRVTAGQADATGTVSTPRTTTATGTNASFQGILLGGDFSCSRGVTGGVNFAVGGLLGLNQGSTSQPISQAIFAQGGAGGGTTSVNESDFRQTYVGAYGVFTRGPFAADLQFRAEKTAFDISNVPVAGATALFGDTSFGSDAQTLSGAVTYTFPIRDTGFAVTPRLGFSWTRTSTDEITLSNPAGGNPDILRVDDFQNQVGFLGLAVSRARPLATQDGGTSMFVSATYYNDFASDPQATLLIAGASANTEDLTLTNLGAYGELSAGWSYTRQLKGGVGGSRQMSATVRGDARTGASLDSWGITGQLRLQF